jgi:hypothetical protein
MFRTAQGGHQQEVNDLKAVRRNSVHGIIV